MTLVSSFPMSSTFAGIRSLQANGTIDTGNNLPAGIAGFLDIVNTTMKATINQTDTPTATGIRSEIVPVVAAALGDEQWFTWEFYLDSADWTQNTGQISIAQIHPEDTIVAAVDFALIVQDRILWLYIPSSEPPTLGANSTATPIGDVQFNHWYTCCLHALWQNTTTGFMEFFMDQKPAYRRWGRGTAYTSDAPYFKLGVYDAPHLANFGTKAAYFRNIKIYSGNDGYDAVMGNPPITTKQYLEA